MSDLTGLCARQTLHDRTTRSTTPRLPAGPRRRPRHTIAASLRRFADRLDG